MTIQDRFRLDGKIAVVTGGSRGIGRAIAIGLAQAGADVVVSSRDGGRCSEVAGLIATEGVRGVGIRCDASVAEDIDNLFDHVSADVGGCDILVHCAGIADTTAATKTSREQLQSMLDLHFLGGVHAAQRAAVMMEPRGGGAIVLVGSIWGLGGVPYSLAYGSAKAALAHAVKVLAIEWALKRIRVNGLAPGWVDTDMTAGVQGAALDRIVKRIPMTRAGRPDEMAGPALFLCTEASSFMTGQMLVVDGGERAR